MTDQETPDRSIEIERAIAKVSALKEPAPPKERMSLDEILARIDEVARDPEDRDRFKALKMLASAETSSVVLPKPLSDADLCDRLGRLMLGAGERLTRIAFKRAFPLKRTPMDAAVKLDVSQLRPDQQAIIDRIKSVRMYYRTFPEVKQKGLPVGFPRGGGQPAKLDWLRNAAAKILLDREKAKMMGLPEPGK